MKPKGTFEPRASGDEETWIEGPGGLVATINPALGAERAWDLAELLANGANFLIARREHAAQIAPKGGRPRHKKPSAAAIAKRRSRERAKARESKDGK